MAENGGAKQRKPRGAGKRFEPGRSGNPAGKPVGTRNRTTEALETLLDGQAEAITAKCIEMAISGDGLAMRLCMERVVPLRRGRPVKFNLPKLEGPADLTRALGGLLQATADGSLTPEEAGTIAAILETKRRAHETVELETRLLALEKATAL